MKGGGNAYAKGGGRVGRAGLADQAGAGGFLEKGGLPLERKVVDVVGQTVHWGLLAGVRVTVTSTIAPVWVNATLTPVWG